MRVAHFLFVRPQIPMTFPSFQNLKPIRFQSELLPQWAQLLDLASRLCSMPSEVEQWFSKFTNFPGADDAATIVNYSCQLRVELLKQRDSLVSQLRRHDRDLQAEKILAAWDYSLETMIQVASPVGTCSWTIDGFVDEGGDDLGGGDDLVTQGIKSCGLTRQSSQHA